MLAIHLLGWLAPLLILLLPFANTVIGRRMLAVLLPVLAWSWLRAKAREFTSLLLPLACTFVWAITSALWATRPKLTLMESIFDFLLPAGAFLGVAAAASTPEGFKRLSVAGLASVFGMLAVSAVLVAMGIPLVDKSVLTASQRGGMATLYPGPGPASTAVALVLGVLPLLKAELRRPRLALIAAILGVLAIGALSQNRMIWLVASLILALGIILQWKRVHDRVAVRAALLSVGVLLIGLTALALINSVRPGSVGPTVSDKLTGAVVRDTRIKAWPLWLDYARERPWLGHGYSKRSIEGALTTEGHAELAAIAPQIAGHAHNWIINTYVQLGVPGVALLVWLILAHFRLWVSAYRSPDDRVSDIGVAGILLVLAMIAKNMTDDFTSDRIAMTFWAYAGLLAGRLWWARAPQETYRSAGGADMVRSSAHIEPPDEHAQVR